MALGLDQQEIMVQALLAGWARQGLAPEHRETHISHVLLVGGQAYKIKKALATTFLDQSTLERRRAACDEELRLNRRLAPTLYLGVQAITGTPAQPVLGGAGPVLDWAVHMRAFDEDQLWSRLAKRGALTAADIDDVAAQVAGLHAHAAAAPPGSGLGSAVQVRAALQGCLDGLRAGPNTPAEDEQLQALGLWAGHAFPALAPVFERRAAGGRVREGHGDLHLGNVAREQGHALVFDGIEFNPAYRWIDVMSDVAFLVMDLQAQGLPGLAWRFIDAYLQHSGDHDGLRVLRFYAVYRALVRARVARLRAAQAGGDPRARALASAAHYLRVACTLAQPGPRALLITHGLAGCGKSTLSEALVAWSGAVRVRADVERKRLAGLAPLASSRSLPGAGLYDAAMNARTLARLLAAARAALEGGWPVILDACFLRRADREAAAALATELGVPFVILAVEAPLAVLRERVRQRTRAGADASEADERVLEHQLGALEPLTAGEQQGPVHHLSGLSALNSEPSSACQHAGDEGPERR